MNKAHVLLLQASIQIETARGLFSYDSRTLHGQTVVNKLRLCGSRFLIVASAYSGNGEF